MALEQPPAPRAPADLRRVATLLDAAIRIPGTDVRVGLDPLLGLAPGLGDALSTLLSGWIVVRAAGLGARPATLLRMTGNVLLDALIGSVPVLGDIFDVGFRANQRNVDLLESQLADPVARAQVDRRLVVAVAVAAVLIPLGVTILVGWLAIAALRAAGL